MCWSVGREDGKRVGVYVVYGLPMKKRSRRPSLDGRVGGPRLVWWVMENGGGERAKGVGRDVVCVGRRLRKEKEHELTFVILENEPSVPLLLPMQPSLS